MKIGHLYQLYHLVCLRVIVPILCWVVYCSNVKQSLGQTLEKTLCCKSTMAGIKKDLNVFNAILEIDGPINVNVTEILIHIKLCEMEMQSSPIFLHVPGHSKGS